MARAGWIFGISFDLFLAPILQVKTFATTHARYIKLTALGNTQDNDVVGYGEVDVMTD